MIRTFTNLILAHLVCASPLYAMDLSCPVSQACTPWGSCDPFDYPFDLDVIWDKDANSLSLGRDGDLLEFVHFDTTEQLDIVRATFGSEAAVVTVSHGPFHPPLLNMTTIWDTGLPIVYIFRCSVEGESQ